MGEPLDHEMVRLALSDRQALWPTTLRANLKRPPTWVSDVEELVGQIGSADYFNPHGFMNRHRNGECASPEGNLVWLDLDPPKSMPAPEVGAWLEGRVEEMRASLPLFSIRLSSGRGQWLFWKLTGLISKEEVNRLNRILPRLGGSDDTGRWRCQGWVRMPGSVNEKTGVTSACIEINDGRHDPERLGLAIDTAAAKAGIDVLAPIAGAIDTAPLKVGSIVPEIAVTSRLRSYIDTRPTWNEAQALGIDRSSFDQSLVARLVNAGSSDEAIKAYFEHHLPARYEEERDCGRGDYYLRLGIRSARAGLKRFPASPLSVCISGDDPHPAETAPRPHVRVRDEDVLRVVGKHQGKPKKLVEAAVCEALGCSAATAKRHVNLLAKGKNPYVEFVPINGKSKAVHLTKHADAYFERSRTSKFPLSLDVGFLRANPSRRHKTKTPVSKKPAKAARPKGQAKPVSKQTLAKRITNQLRYHQIGDMPRFSWRGQKRTHYLQILDYIELIETSGRAVYDQIMLPGTHQIGDLSPNRFDTFISWRWYDHEGMDTDDPLRRIDPEVYRPRPRLLATAVVVEAKGTDFEVATWEILDEQSGEWITKPAVGWIIEDGKFWDEIVNNPEIYEDRVFKAVRHGKGATRSFTHTPTEISLNLDPYRDLIDREAYLKQWADHARLQAVADSLPPDWKPYPQAPTSFYRRNNR